MAQLQLFLTKHVLSLYCVYINTYVTFSKNDHFEHRRSVNITIPFLSDILVRPLFFIWFDSALLIRIKFVDSIRLTFTDLTHHFLFDSIFTIWLTFPNSTHHFYFWLYFYNSILLHISDQILLHFLTWFEYDYSYSTHRLRFNSDFLFQLDLIIPIQFNSEFMIQFDSVIQLYSTHNAHIWLTFFDSTLIIWFNSTRTFWFNLAQNFYFNLTQYSFLIRMKLQRFNLPFTI